MEKISEVRFQLETASGRDVIIRQCKLNDQERLESFYSGISQDELMHFDEDVTNPEVILRKLKPSKDQENISLVAVLDDQIISEGTLMRRLNSRSAHVGKIMLYVAPEYRHAGIGSRLLKVLYQRALQRGVEKLYGTVPETAYLIFKEILQRFGFCKEAVLANHLKDSRGRQVNLVIVAQDLNTLWEKMEDWQSPYGRAMEY